MLLAQRVAFVVFLLAFCHGKFDFRSAIKEIKLQRNQGVTTGSDAVSELRDFLFVQQQLSLAPRGMVRPCGLGVFGNMHGLKPGFPSIDRGIRIYQGCATRAKRLDFRAAEDNPRFYGVFNVES